MFKYHGSSSFYDLPPTHWASGTSNEVSDPVARNYPPNAKGLVCSGLATRTKLLGSLSGMRYACVPCIHGTEMRARKKGAISYNLMIFRFLQGGSTETGLSGPLLCQNKRLVIGVKPAAFAALKENSESEDARIHVPSLSKTLLDTDIVLKFPEGKEEEQAFLVHIIARSVPT